MNGAGPAHGKEASEGVWGRRAGCVVGGGQRDCCSGLSGKVNCRSTVWQSELPEHLCSGKLDGLLGEGLVVCQCGRGGSRRAHGGGSRRAHGGERGVRARRLGGLRRKWRQLRLQPRRGHRRLRMAAMQAAAPEAAMWAVMSVTGTRGAATRVEVARRSRTLGVRELVTPRALAVTPCTADKSL